MRIDELLRSSKPTLSFEFFPPKTEKSSTALYQSIQELHELRPDFVSVTYGAGGGTRELTHNLVVKLSQEESLLVVPHLTCVGHTQEEILSILQKYWDHGIRNIMALRGDPPKDQPHFKKVQGGFGYAAELISFIKKHFPEMGIGAAGFPEGHPECPNRLLEIDYLKAKVDAGVDYICTQLFFNNADFYDYKERCEIAGISIPIVAGIMPVTGLKNMKRMSELAQGARFPAKLLKSLSRAEDDDYAQKVGIHWATEQVLDLLNNGVDGVHFYTLNKSQVTLDITKSVGIKDSHTLKKNKDFSFL